MMSGKPSDIPCGDVCAWQLPHDTRCASHARSILAPALMALAFPQPTIEDATLAVSELATNAHQHGTNIDKHAPITPFELWTWARTWPQPELVVAVFDTHRDTMPHRRPGHLLNERGRGLGIVNAIARTWGYHLSRSWLLPQPTAGKVTWFTVPLPASCSRPAHRVSPAVAAQRLALLLSARGLTASHRNGKNGTFLITAERLSITVSPTAFYWSNGDNGQIRHPLTDLGDTAEHIIQTLEETHSSMPN